MKKRYQFWEAEAAKLQMEVLKFGDFESSQGSQCADVSETEDASPTPTSKKQLVEPAAVVNVFDSIMSAMTGGPSPQDPDTDVQNANDNCVDVKPQVTYPEHLQQEININQLEGNGEGPESSEDSHQAATPQPWHFIQTFVSNCWNTEG